MSARIDPERQWPERVLGDDRVYMLTAVVAKLCREDQDQLDRIERLLTIIWEKLEI